MRAEQLLYTLLHASVDSIHRSKKLEGVIVSLLTPFTPDQRVDFGALRRLVRFLLGSGIHGFYVTGSAGEWVRLNNEERRTILETVIDETNGRVPIVAHVGHFSTMEAVELAHHAASAGADYVSSVVPGYYRYSPAELLHYYGAIAAAGAPVIIYYLEHAGALDAREFVERFSAVENIAGLKYTASDLFPMQAVHELSGGRLTVWSGHDQMALAGLLMNARGVIGTNYNYIPEIYVELYEAYLVGNLIGAQSLQQEANRILLAVKQFGSLPAYKEALALRGVPVGECRRPGHGLSACEREALVRAVEPFANRLKPVA